MAAKPKCDCGCGEAPASTTRLRRIACPCGASILRLSRAALQSIDATCRLCGDPLEPTCLYDLTYTADAEQALAELETRQLLYAERSAQNANRKLGQMRCGNDACKAYVSFGANVDATAAPEPCKKCGSTLPARFVPREVRNVVTSSARPAAADIPF